MSSQAKRTSSVVTGSPSDHFRPLRRVKVKALLSSQLRSFHNVADDALVADLGGHQEGLVHGHEDVGVPVGHTVRRAQGAAVLAGLPVGQVFFGHVDARANHEGLFGQAFFKRRQIAGGNQLIQHGGLGITGGLFFNSYGSCGSLCCHGGGFGRSGFGRRVGGGLCCVWLLHGAAVGAAQALRIMVAMIRM